MSKLIVKLPSGWDAKVIMDSKDFATICDIIARSQGIETKYKEGNYYTVLSDVSISASNEPIGEPMTQAAYDALWVKTEFEEVAETT